MNNVLYSYLSEATCISSNEAKKRVDDLLTAAQVKAKSIVPLLRQGSTVGWIIRTELISASCLDISGGDAFVECKGRVKGC